MKTVEKSRAPISNLIQSLLEDEISRRCPKCGKFEDDIDSHFDNHHINGDASISEYWNLIRLCRPCHDICEENKDKIDYVRRIKRLKKHLFRQYIGPAAYDVLLHAHEKGPTLMFPCVVRTLIQLGLVDMLQKGPMNVGMAVKPNFNVYKITDLGAKWSTELDLSWSNEE